ncbi:MAG: hypothetical protein Kow0029_03730 [Candidatus Rifleibacteriota bacterium]
MKKLLKLFLIVTVVVGFCGTGFAQDDMSSDDIAGDEEVIMGNASENDSGDIAGDEGVMEEAPAPAPEKGDAVDYSGVVEVTPADTAKGEKFATIILKAGEESLKLIPSENKDAFKGLEEAAGKTITVKGTYLPADDEHPIPAIQVTEWSE